MISKGEQAVFVRCHGDKALLAIELSEARQLVPAEEEPTKRDQDERCPEQPEGEQSPPHASTVSGDRSGKGSGFSFKDPENTRIL